MSGNPFGKHPTWTGHQTPQRPAAPTTTVTPLSGDGRQRGSGKQKGKMPIEQTPKRERIGAGK